MSPVRVLRKLRGRSATELRIRSLQTASAWLERLNLSADVREPSDATFWRRLAPDTRRATPVGDAPGLLDAFRTRSNRFFAAFDDRDATVRELRRRWPEAARRIVMRADAVRDGVFDLLGYDGLRFGTPIDWHRDPVAGRVAPRAHWSRIDYLDPAVVGDHKVTWELNRHQYFVTLGRAHWLTGDERYAEVIAEHLESWMNANPPKLGVNWASSLEVAYRVISWVWALHFLRDSAALTPALFRRVLGYIDLQARHVARNLSTYFSPNTHLTGEALGLLVVGVCFPELAGSDTWLAMGRSILENELQRQVRPDGVYVEQSPHYHRYTLDIYLHAAILADRIGGALADPSARLPAAFDHAMYITMPDGSFPLVGDDDGGRLLSLDAAPPNDFRPALATAAALYHRRDYAAVAGGPAEEILWLLGPAGLAAYDEQKPEFPREPSRAFVDGGVYVMRDGWSPSDNYLYVDAGPHGFLTGGHAHADALSFILVAGGRSLLVDPGTCVYTSTDGERDRFRGTAAHNTITIDGASSSEPGPGPFQWRSTAGAEVSIWRAEGSWDFLEAAHSGFMRLTNPVRHERSILYVRRRYWVIRDRLVGDGAHQATLHFHSAPGIEPSVEASGQVALRVSEGGRRAATLATFGGDGSFSIHPDCVCPEYGRRVPATTCEYRLSMAGTTEVLTFVLPSGADDLVVSEDGAGRFAVAGDGVNDVHVFGTAADPELHDARWLWRRRDVATREVVEEVVLDGESHAAQPAAPVARGMRHVRAGGAGGPFAGTGRSS